jgi:outer membrane lipoprotein-sorting protein
MNTNHSPQDPLEAAEAALRDVPPHISPSPATLDRIAALAAERDLLSTSRTTTFAAARGWRKVAAILLTSAALVAAVFGLMHTPQSTFALEDVAAAVRQANTVSYTTVLTPKTGPASQYKNYYKGTLTRTEFADGSYSLTDSAGQKLLMVNPAVKTASLTHLGNKSEKLPVMSDMIINWLKTAEATGEKVGERTIDGVRTQGFKAAFGATTMILWGDPKTKLPVLIESTIDAGSGPVQMAMQQFVFNGPLNDALFSFEVPAGFQTKETKLPTVDFAALVKLPPEEHVVRILKFYAGLNDGAFPERIDGPELVSKITTSAGAKRLEDPEFMKEFMTLTGSMGASWTFRQSLDQFGYRGSAHLNDADSIVFWYLPKDAKKYRVVFADLTIGDVTEEKLSKESVK